MHRYSTEKNTTRSSLTYKGKKIAYFLAFGAAIAKSKKIIVPSLATKKDFLEYYSWLDEDKIVLAYEGVEPNLVEGVGTTNPAKTLKKYEIQKPFLLYVSSMYRHKNVDKLLEAFKILHKKYNFEGQLVLVGKKDYFSEEIFEKVCESSLENRIKMPGIQEYVTDEELIDLRKSAELYVFPSLMEGFSLTPLEAMAQGLPCVISNIDCHKEIYEDSAVYFDPNNTSDIAEKINKVLKNPDLREQLKEKGFAQVKKYSWEETARITLETFKEILYS